MSGQRAQELSTRATDPLSDRLGQALSGVPEGVAAQLIALARSMNADGARREDPMREVFARLGDKWSMLLLLVLRAGPFRHAMLRRLINSLVAEEAISQRVFTLQLRALERDGLVRRTITPSTPPQVEYALSALGLDLLEQIDGLMNWVRRHSAAMREAQGVFDQADRA